MPTRLGLNIQVCNRFLAANSTFAGQSSIAISSRQVHLSETVQHAMPRSGAHRNGNNEKTSGSGSTEKPRKLRREGGKSGAPGEIRTPDLTLRRRSLYPAELRAHWQNYTRGLARPGASNLWTALRRASHFSIIWEQACAKLTAWLARPQSAGCGTNKKAAESANSTA